MSDQNIESFLSKIQEAFQANQLVKLVIGKKRFKSAEVKAIYIKPLEVKGEAILNFVIRNNTNDITKNYNLEKALIKIQHALETLFYTADLFTTAGDLHYLSNKRNTIKIIEKKASFTEVPQYTHDKQKVNYISTIDNVYLKSLGVISDEGKVYKDKTDKFRQINKYIELLSPIIEREDLKTE